jgi:hypothetical protein
MRTAAVVALMGIWMLAAPFMPMPVEGRFLNDLVVGLVITNAGVMMASGEGWVRYLTTAVGIWIAVSSFIPLMLGSALTRNAIITGSLLLIAGVGAINYGLHHPEPEDPRVAL